MLERNPADQEPDVDALTGTTTTGHVWDGIRELNTPLPRWWLWLFYATILWAVGYWIVYPSWPLVSSYTKGAFRWQSRDAVVSDLDALKAQRGPMVGKAQVGIAAGDRVGSDSSSISRARRLARLSRRIARLATVRAAAAGEAIRTSTMMNGSGAAISTRSRRPSATASAPEMPMHGRAQPCRLSAATASSSAPMSTNVGDFVRSLAGVAPDLKADLTAGKKIFSDNCAVCHGETGKGKRELGAPNLSDAIWLYGADKPSIVDGIWNGRGGMMPAWAGRLDDATIKALAVYVHSLGGGEK